MFLIAGPARSLWRRFTIVLATIAMTAITLPTVAMAAAPITTTDTAHGTGARITTADGTIDFSIFYSTLIGARGSITYTGPLGQLFGPEGFAEMVGNRLTGEFFLIDGATGESPGFALYDIEFTTAGSESDTHRVVQDGNHRTIFDLVQQPMLANGTLTMPDGTVFPLIDLPANRFVADTWSNNPAATILDGSETFIEATWLLDETPLTFRVHVTELDSSAVVFLMTEAGEIIGTAQPALVEDAMSAAFTLTRSDRTVAGDAKVELRVIELGSSVGFEETEISRQRLITTQIAVAGELTATLDGITHTFDFADADLFTTRQSWHGLQFPHVEDGEG